MDKNLIESTRLLNRWVSDESGDWVSTGKNLHELFYTGSDKDIKIAVTAAGAIPYYSRLPTIDMHGLNTRAVIYHTNRPEARPGHRHKANLNFLHKARVNLIIDHPIYIKNKLTRGARLYYDCMIPGLWSTHSKLWHIPVVFIPMQNGYYLLAHYLTPHPTIDQHLNNHVILDEKAVKRRISCYHSKDIALMHWLKSP